MVTPEPVNGKPLLRGVLHHSAAWFSLGAGAVLVATASTTRAAIAAGVYCLSLVTLFAVSAIYHRVQWSPPARARMRRADHASIFVLIAGTYTPVSLYALGEADGRRMLILIWSFAAAGVLLSLFWPKAPKALTALVAVAMGWMIVPYFTQVRGLLGESVWLILAGGIVYTIGAIVYALKRPDPWPRVFGYHEVFHALTLVGAFLHFGVIVYIVRSA
jgi:hemolysin III